MFWFFTLTWGVFATYFWYLESTRARRSMLTTLDHQNAALVGMFVSNLGQWWFVAAGI